MSDEPVPQAKATLDAGAARVLVQSGGLPALERALTERLLDGATGSVLDGSPTAAPVGATALCVECKGTGRVLWWQRAARLPLKRVTPCPSCRPQASDLGADGSLKSEAARRDAAAARGRGL